MAEHSPVTALQICRITPTGSERTEDLVATEEPLALKLGYSTEHGREGRDLAITMRTPGNDFELAAGFLFSEGIIESAADIYSIRHCTAEQPTEQMGNLLRIELREGRALPPHIFQRHSFISSSCGICGKSSIEAIQTRCPALLPSDSFSVSASILHSLPAAVSSRQRVFGATGGLHAAALFDSEGNLQALQEDVGRHNAVDKLLGQALNQGWIPLQNRLLFLSGRSSFELLQKSAMAGIPLVCAVGAPSSLAVECARHFGITLIGFLRNQRFNIYNGEQRIEAGQ